MSARFDAYKQAQHHKEREAKKAKLFPFYRTAPVSTCRTISDNPNISNIPKHVEKSKKDGK